MNKNDILVLRGEEVIKLLKKQELRIIDTVQAAYAAHAKGESSLPHSLFLRFPDDPRKRIIALPAFLNDGFNAAGMKWIASFPSNSESGLDRASAVLIINSAITGRPEAMFEASVISAKRTAASAALAARCLSSETDVDHVGLIGCGLINFEIVRFLLAVFPSLSSVAIYDKSPDNAAVFKQKVNELSATLEVEIKPKVDDVFASGKLISFATTAVEPFVDDINTCIPGSTILHVSLRDLKPQVILGADNIVDDVDHVCRAQTSVHLAEGIAGNREFIRGTLADVFGGAAPAKRDPSKVTIFSPFGLGVLDIAVGKLVCDLAAQQAIGTRIQSFLPEAWHQRLEDAVA
jgi:2,3-diaminopropionate biosynthesis protein SbnB